MRISLLSFLFVFAVTASFGQCLIQNIPLSQRVASSTLIVEGEVIQKTSFLSDDRIYTENVVHVYQQFKGVNAVDQTLTVFTWGGQVGDRLEVANPSLQFNLGDKGVFLLDFQETKKDDSGNRRLGYWGVSGPTSFIAYNVLNQQAYDFGVEMGDITSEFYHEFSELCNIEAPVSGRSQMVFPIHASFKRNVTSFSPSTITAGNQKLLTISGSGFGSVQGTVTFANANDGGKTLVQISDDHYFEKWTDSEIQVYVPNGAGTGTVGVITSTSTSYTSSSDLTITYSLLEITSNTPGANPVKKLYSPVLEDDNGNGGLTWVFNADFFKNKPAVNAFLRALENWRCATLVNFDVDTVNTTDIDSVSRDGVHTVMWQNPNQQINSGALGVTYSQWSGCYNSNSKDWHWYLNDVDMVFDDVLASGRTWNFSTKNPTTSQYDFESVALHELGHSHQLGHIIDASGVMHYSIKNGEVKRTLKPTVDIAAGGDVMTRSLVATGCSSGAVAMKAIKSSECKLLNVTRPIAAFTHNVVEVCGTDTFTFVNASNPSGNLTWSISTGGYLLTPFATEDTVLISASKPGKYTVKLVVELGGFYDSTEMNIEFFEPAKILGGINEEITCYGANDGEVRVITTGTLPMTITWRDNNSNTNPRTAMGPGTYWVDLVDKNQCTDSASITLVEPSELVVTADGEDTWGDLERGRVWVSASGGTPPYKVKWSDANNSTTDTLKSLAPGLYLVTVTDANGCEETGTHQVGKLPVGLNGLPEEWVSIYPNPFKSQFTVLNESGQPLQIRLINPLGQEVLSQTLGANKSQVLNTEELGAGVYVLQATVNRRNYTTKIIKQ